MYNRVLRRAELFQHMLGALEIAPRDAAILDRGNAYCAANKHCLICARAPECRRRLETSPSISSPPDFCLNAEFFARCRK